MILCTMFMIHLCNALPGVRAAVQFRGCTLHIKYLHVGKDWKLIWRMERGSNDALSTSTRFLLLTL